VGIVLNLSKRILKFGSLCWDLGGAGGRTALRCRALGFAACSRWRSDYGECVGRLLHKSWHHAHWIWRPTLLRHFGLEEIHEQRGLVAIHRDIVVALQCPELVNELVSVDQ
jgi:hypothetical protein